MDSITDPLPSPTKVTLSSLIGVGIVGWTSLSLTITSLIKVPNIGKVVSFIKKGIKYPLMNCPKGLIGRQLPKPTRVNRVDIIPQREEDNILTNCNRVMRSYPNNSEFLVT